MKIILLIAALSIATAGHAASFCVGSSATGSGTGIDWNNQAAWSSASFARGNTYYLADGAYAAVTLNTATSGTTLITIKKATVSDHGTATGWIDTMGAGQARIKAPVTFQSNYWTIDGTSRSGIRAGYGIKIDNNTTPANVAMLTIGDTSPSVAAHITLKYLEVFGSGKTDDSFSDAGIATSNSGGCTDIAIQSCWFHDFGNVPLEFRQTGNVLVEYSVIERNHSSAAVHAEGVVLAKIDGFIFRYNIISDMEGTAYIATPYGLHNTVANIEIYGNVFYSPTIPLRGGAGLGVFGIFDCDVTGACKFVNNTILGMQSAKVATGHGTNSFTASGIYCGVGNANTSAAELVVENNEWIDCEPISNPSTDPDSHIVSFAWNHNAYFNTVNTSDLDAAKQVFVSSPLAAWGAGDYAPTAATSPGASMPGAYATDPTGLTRGADGVWDRGAYEFVSSSGQQVITPPSNAVVTISVQ